MTRSILPYLVLVGGVIVASTAAILIRLAQQEGMSSLTIAAMRMGLSALILSPIALGRVGGELRRLQRRDLLLGLTSGIFLSLHFASWISSLAYTSVASSAALVVTSPLWVALASWLILHERPGRGTVAGLVLTLSGSALIIMSGMGDDASTQYANPTLGNVLALLGAVAVTGYFLVGRSLRQRLSVLAYIWLVYTTAAIALSLSVLLMGQQIFGLSIVAYLCVLGLALGPQLLGHTSFNWALAHLSATFVAIAILGEPVSSAALAWLIFGEQFEALQLAGFVLLLLGIAIAARDERQHAPASLEQTALVETAGPSGP